MKLGIALSMTAGMVALGLSALSARAETTHSARPQFRRQIEVQSAGSQRLEVDLELLAGTQPNLADLRIFDADQSEVAYLLIAPPTVGATWQDATSLQPTVSDKFHSGFELDLGQVRRVDRLRIQGIAAPVLKRLRLEASGDRTRYSLLAEDETLFDLPEEGLRRMEFDFLTGNYRYLRVIWDDRETRPVELPERVSARLAAVGANPTPPLVEVPFEPRSGQPLLSQWRIRLPGKRLRIAAICLESEQPQLMRQARVSEARPSSEGLDATTLGSAVLRRAVRQGLTAADLRIPIQTPETSELLLTVENGNNPPLELRRIRVELAPQPWIYFEAKRNGSYTARYGTDKLGPPQYDLEVERESVARRLTTQARWAGSAKSTEPPKTAPSANAPNESLLHGSVIAADHFAYSRSINDPGGAMTSLRLDAAVLAHSASLVDLRILDPQRRQVPYLFERESEPLVLDLVIQPLSASDRPKSLDAKHSVYRITLPYPGLPAAKVALRTTSRVFRRDLSLRVEYVRAPGKPKEIHLLTSGTWAHADEAKEPPELELAVATGNDQTLYLVVDDGDNTPLPIVAARLLLESRALRFYHVAGEPLTLHYGNPQLQAPRYDLALLTRELEQLPSREATLGEEVAQPSQPTVTERQAKWFWVILVVTALGLVALIARLVKKS